MAPTDSALAQEADRMYAGIVAHVTVAVRRAQQEHDISAETDPVDLARALLAVMSRDVVA